MKNGRFPLFILTLILIFGLVACGGEEPTPEPEPTAVLPTTAPPTDIPPTPTDILPTITVEPKETAVSPTSISVTDETADGNIAYDKYTDGNVSSNGRSLWSFDAVSGDYIYVTVAPASGFDAVIDIVDQDGESILPLGAVDDSFGEEITDIQIPADGQYFIAISGFGDSSGDYQLILSTSLDAPISTDLPDGSISQWASRAVASSEFSNDSWAAFQAEGAPDTYDCGDIPTAWAAANSSTVEWIELYYNIPVEVTEINIYQSFNPDQVVSVELITTSGEYVPIFEQAQVGEENCPYILSLAVESSFASDGIRVTIDQSAFSDWTEIDAVELVGLSVDGGGGSVNQLPSSSAGDPLDGVLWRVGGASGFEEGMVGHFDGVAYDAERGLIYVANSFDGIIVMNEAGETIDLFTTDSSYFSPADVALDAVGNIYVANDTFDDDEGRIIVFSPEGDVIHEYGSDGTGDGEFGILSPSSLMVAADGTTYVFDSNDDSAGETIYRIQKFSADGTFEAIIPIDPDYSTLYDTPMAIGADGFLYFSDWLDGMVVKMDGDGNVIKEIRRGDDFFYTTIQALDVDAAGNIYIAVWDEPAIIKLDQDGNELATFGFEVEDGAIPWAAGGFYWPNGLAVSPDGRTVYVTDWSGDYAYLTAVDMSQ